MPRTSIALAASVAALFAAPSCRSRDRAAAEDRTRMAPQPAVVVTVADASAAPPAGDAALAPQDAAASPSTAPAPLAAFVGATLWDGTGRPPVPDAVVVLAGDRIRDAGPRGEVEVPAGATVVDAAGKWIVPGLIDAHVHFFQSGGLYTRPDVVDLRAVRPYAAELAAIHAALDDSFRRILAAGVTAVVDVGGPFWNFEVRERANAAPLAPHVAVAGPLISTVDDQPLDLGDPPIVRAASPDDARALVRRQLERRPDLIKVWYIVDDTHSVEAGLPMVCAVIDEAHAAGADVLVHSVHDLPIDQAFVDLLREHGTIVIPNLVVLEGYAEVLTGAPVLLDIERRLGDPEVIASWGEFDAVAGDDVRAKGLARRDKYLIRAPIMRGNLARLHEAGVPLAAGTDAGNIGTLHGPTLHRELELLVAAGLTPEEALLAATREAARVFAAQPDFGTIEPGREADLLVLDADPLADVRNLRRIRLVVRGGIVLAPDRIHAPNPEWVVQEQLDAYNARDLERFLAVYAPDALLERQPTGEVLETGDAMHATYAQLFSSSPELHCRVLHRTVLGPFVVDQELVTGLASGPYLHALATYEVRDGLIRHVWFLRGP
jgi:imidazolonepropionase-like amidohydrolase